MTNLTKKAIREAFMALLDERPLNKITVKDVVVSCGINRNSFYYHYPDLPALIEEIVRDECDRIIGEAPSLDSMEKCVNMAMDFVLSRRRAVMHIYESVNRDVFEHYLWKLCGYAVGKYLDIAFHARKVTPENRTMIMRLLEGQLFGLIMGWMKDGMNEERVEDVRRFGRIYSNHAETLIVMLIDELDDN